MRKLLNIKLLAILFLLYGCVKDQSTTVDFTGSQPEEGCEPYVYTGSEVIEAMTSSGDQYTQPCYNPNDGDEFIYIKNNNILIKRKISTGQEIVLLQNVFITSQPVWSHTGWIFYKILQYDS